MARVLIVGCGCRGRELVAPLVAAGHSVRGTTRSSERLGEIEAAGAEGVVADPDRLGTVLAAVEGVTVVVWLLASADGDNAAEVLGPRLETFLERLVDTPVRGFVLERAGSAPGDLRESAERLVRAAEEHWRLPVEVVAGEPTPQALSAAVARLLR